MDASAKTSSVYDFFAYLIEQYIGVNNALAGKDRTAILAVFASRTRTGFENTW